jgi:hypothetical protein
VTQRREAPGLRTDKFRPLNLAVREPGGRPGLLWPDVEEKDVVSFDRLHGSAGLLLHAGTNLSGLCVAPLSCSLAFPERDSERFPGLAVGENDVADVAGLVAYAWMHDVASNSRHISDSIGRGL